MRTREWQQTWIFDGGYFVVKALIPKVEYGGVRNTKCKGYHTGTRIVLLQECPFKLASYVAVLNPAYKGAQFLAS